MYWSQKKTAVVVIPKRKKKKKTYQWGCVCRVQCVLSHHLSQSRR